MNRIVRALGLLVVRAPAVVIVVVVLLTGVLGYYNGQQQQVTGNEGFSPDNPELRALERSGEQFGGSETVMQVIVQSTDDDVFTADAWTAVNSIRDTLTAEFGDELSSQPGRDAVISWLAPVAQSAQSRGVDPATLDPSAFKQLYREAYTAIPPEQTGFVAPLVTTGGSAPDAEGGAGLMLVFLDSTGDTGDIEAATAVQNEIRGAVGDIDLPDGVSADAFAFGLLFEEQDVTGEIARLLAIAALIIMAVLAFVYFVRPAGDSSWPEIIRRTAADVAITMAAIFIAITWTNGIGVLLGPDYAGVIGYFNPVTQIISILLIGLGVDYAIHLSSRYREQLAGGDTVDESAYTSLTTVGIALVLATATTFVGFLTNLTNPLPALVDFGILAAVGILAAFLVLMTFVLACRTLLDRRADGRQRLPRASLESSKDKALPALMARTSWLAEHAPIPTLGVTLLLAVAGGYGLSQLETTFSFTDFIPEDAPVLETYETLQDRFDGGFGETTTVLVEGDVATPAAHNAMVSAWEGLADVDNVRAAGGNALADLPPVVLGQALAPPPGAAAGEPPDPDAAQQPQGEQPADGQQAPDGASPAAVPPALAQAAAAAGFGPDLRVDEGADVAALYRALLEARPDVAGQVLAEDGDGFVAQTQIQTSAGEGDAGTLRDDIADSFAPVTDAGLDATPTSDAIISDVIITEVQNAQVQSLLITVAAAMVLLVITFWIRRRRPFLGVLTVLPVGLVLLWTFGLMAALGIPFGPVTATISALAIGIGVPFTIHVAVRFLEDRARFDDAGDVLRSTTRFTGGALAGSAFTTIAGFGVLTFSSLTPFRQLGTVVAIAVACSLVAAVLVLPSMLILWDRWHRRHDDSAAVDSATDTLEPAAR